MGDVVIGVGGLRLFGVVIVDLCWVVDDCDGVVVECCGVVIEIDGGGGWCLDCVGYFVLLLVYVVVDV